ncbi:putative quinol monooxygenase [Pseudomonas sp. St316]|uniref:putative quinol monooxygenase n=1 Tax=Pseudomonas sp. St316 TaxID=2678257 RepID=UPI001BEF399D|nr:putative quinol monooxygenase [Pseudomonas sp. St316]BBP59983.1 antibiotic biosynthesis monooxygenase [Pseudomonas sp. St316]
MTKNRKRLLTAAFFSGMACSLGTGTVQAQETPTTVVRIAELVIDPAQLDAYKVALREEMEESIRVEPGVLAIYSVAEKEKPNSLRFFEIYASEQAYRAHIESAHFKKYVAITQPMILSRKLIETQPVQLSAKALQPD